MQLVLFVGHRIVFRADDVIVRFGLCGRRVTVLFRQILALLLTGTLRVLLAVLRLMGSGAESTRQATTGLGSL